MKKYLAVLLVLLCGVFSLSTSAYAAEDNDGTMPSPQAVEASTAHTCLRFDNRQYEVCSAYIFNCSLGARLPFYKFATSSNSARSTLATNRLESRYRGSARTFLEGQVQNWPSSVDVDIPRLAIRSVFVSSDHNRAVLRTRETWSVTTQGGQNLFRESAAAHLIRMQRVPGLVLHKWVVTSIN